MIPPENTAQKLYGVGEGFEPDEAKNAALSDANGRLKTVISSKFESDYSADSSGTSQSISQKISSQIGKLAFNNYNVVRSENIGNSVITMIEIDVVKLVNEYIEDIKQARIQMQNLANSPGGIMKKFNNLNKAVEIGTNTEAKIRIIKTIDANFDGGADILYINTIYKAFSEITARIRISVAAQDQEISSIINYGLNKLNIGVENSSAGSPVVIKIAEKWVENAVMGSNMAKLTLNISVIDSDGTTIGTSIADSTGSSVTNQEMARRAAIGNMKKSIDQKGVLSFLGVKL